MNCRIIEKSSLSGTISIPPSKSHTLRALLFGAMGKGNSRVLGSLDSPDATAMIRACSQFGAKFILKNKEIEIEGIGGKIGCIKDPIDAGNSGIVLRFCSAIAALGNKEVIITGDQSICSQRPIKPLLEGLSQLGCRAVSMKENGYAPVIIQGPLQSGKALIDGADSQPVSALLIAGAFIEGGIELEVRNPGEKPWIGLTLDWFDRLGLRYRNDNYVRYQVFGNQEVKPFEYKVPGDLSSAAFPIGAALVTRSELTVQNIDLQDCQGDKELISVFQQMGADIEVDPLQHSLRIKKGRGLKGTWVDINNFIDAITILATVACFAEGETVIFNGAVAKQKECNRIHCIATELKKMGADIQETEDGLIIKQSPLKGAHLFSYNDHRMVMSLAVAALGAEGETCIEGVELVKKTYPTFFDDFKQLGAKIR